MKSTTSRLRGSFLTLLTILFSFALVAAACGDGDGDDATDSGDSGDSAAESSDAPRMAIVYSADWLDGSWGQAAHDGANAMRDAGTIGDLLLQDNVPPGAEAERALRDAAEDGYNPIIAHSFDYGENIKAVAADYPDTIFVYAGGFGDVAANVGDYDQPFYQASYLSGILAAGATVEGSVAGAGGFEIPACYSMYEAYLAGAQEVRPGTTGSFVAVGDWYDVQLAKEAALSQQSQGATMFIGCGQGPTFGQIEAATDTGGVSTGYVGDMADVGPSVLSSFVWRLDRVFELVVADVAAGKSEAQYYSVPLADGGMDMVITSGREDDISTEALELYEQRLKEIQAGEFEVPLVPQAG